MLVAIENQLEWTDTHHLGQLLTYATGCNAPIAIWVASGFTHEYAKALHLLNEWTKDRDQLLWRQGRGHQEDRCARAPEPRFRKVVYPGGWDKDLSLPPDPPMPPHVQKHHDFFRPLIGELIRSGFADKAVQNFATPAGSFPPASTRASDTRRPSRGRTTPG